jgi:hypothetical protein
MQLVGEDRGYQVAAEKEENVDADPSSREQPRMVDDTIRTATACKPSSVGLYGIVSHE